MGLDLFARFRGELLDFAERVAPPIRVAGTPSEVVHRDDASGFKLVRYLSGGRGGDRVVLLVPHIINRPYILDLHEDVSVVRRFCDRAFEVYLIDWGYPSAQQRNLAFADYSRYVNTAVGLVSQSEVNILGYCTGGIIALIYAALHPDAVGKLVLLATPVDFSSESDPRVLWGKLFDTRRAAEVLGNIPGEMANLAGAQLLALYWPLFALEADFVAEFLRIEFWRDAWRRTRWIVDSPSIPAGACEDLVERCYRQNLLVRNRFRAEGRVVNLRHITCPLLSVLARYDHIVSPQSALGLRDVYPQKQYQEIIFPSSHIGLSAGKRAHEELWPGVIDWIATKRGAYSSFDVRQ